MQESEFDEELHAFNRALLIFLDNRSSRLECPNADLFIMFALLQQAGAVAAFLGFTCKEFQNMARHNLIVGRKQARAIKSLERQATLSGLS